MDWWDALFLGLIQGITEFFPISSSTHLKIARLLLGMAGNEEGDLFDLFCHLGTAVPLLFYFRKELSLFRRECSLFLFALIPLIPFYPLFHSYRGYFSQFESIGLYITAAWLLLASSWRKRANQPLGRREALWIGVAQSIALLPGVSRSGATIGIAFYKKVFPQKAVAFSFLLSFPLILGGVAVSLGHSFFSSQQLSPPSLNCWIGFGAAAIAGSMMIKSAISIWEKGSLLLCSLYCLFAGFLINCYL